MQLHDKISGIGVVVKCVVKAKILTTFDVYLIRNGN